MKHVYTYPERKEIYSDDLDELTEEADALKEKGFVPMSDVHKAMGTFRQTFLKQATFNNSEE